jgi:uncharacterized protein YuzE
MKDVGPFVVLVRPWPGRLALVDCVVDLDRYGELNGIEVLFLRQRVPELAAGLTQPGQTPDHVSYDPEADALYYRRRDAQSPIQKSGTAALVYDDHGNLLAIGASIWPS